MQQEINQICENICNTKWYTEFFTSSLETSNVVEYEYESLMNLTNEILADLVDEGIGKYAKEELHSLIIEQLCIEARSKFCSSFQSTNTTFQNVLGILDETDFLIVSVEIEMLLSEYNLEQKYYTNPFLSSGTMIIAKSDSKVSFDVIYDRVKNKFIVTLKYIPGFTKYELI